ncbi:MAG: Trk system potassium transporter TrkA [Oscillospiraceae bacterium]|nr:Trk system potassium transporter TrkA [Oscillospiraceae bacterium]
MNIIIAGGGKVGQTLAHQLSAEGHNLTMIDSNNHVLEHSVEQYDAMAVSGNCASKEVLLNASVSEADLLIAVTAMDEVNLLCCMTAHGLNPNLHTIARIRTPEYADQIMTMREVFPLSMTVNPEKQAAKEIERLLKFPGFLRRESFAKGRAEIVELRIDASSKLCNLPLSEMGNVIKCRVLVCAVLRAGNAVAPSGNFVLQEGDRIFVTAPTSNLEVLLKNLGIVPKKAKKILICGGGRVSYYLTSLLADDNISVYLMEKDRQQCVRLAKELPNATIIYGDCSSHTLLEDQGIENMDSVITLTGTDETNMIISLYAGSRGVNQIITKLSRAENSALADSMALGSTVTPRELCCNNIVQYVRAMQNQTGAAISVHTIADGQVEAVEFLVDETTKHCSKPLKDIKLKPNVLIASITHGANTQVPNGLSEFMPGDTIVVVTSGRGVLHNVNDIFA